MTESTAPTGENPNSTPRQVVEDTRNEPDELLSALISVVTGNPGMSIGLTLQVAGGTITGNLVARPAWIANLHALHGDKTAGFTAGIKSAWDEQDAESKPDEGIEFRYIHLIDAQFVEGGQTYPQGGMFWRGRLSAVAGWSFGSFLETRP